MIVIFLCAKSLSGFRVSDLWILAFSYGARSRSCVLGLGVSVNQNHLAVCLRKLCVLKDMRRLRVFMS